MQMSSRQEVVTTIPKIDFSEVYQNLCLTVLKDKRGTQISCYLKEDLNVKSIQRTMLMMRHTYHRANIADMMYSMFLRREYRREIQGQTRQHSKLINLLEAEQIYSCVNKIDRDTAGRKQKCDEISNEIKSMSVNDFIGENTHNPPRFVEMTENGDD